MKLFFALKSATLRSLRSWKGILIVWFTSLLLVSMLALPLRGALNSGFGDSMITGKLAEGINIEVFADLGEGFKSLISYFSAGFLQILLAGFLLNAFFSGGLFNCVKWSDGKFTAGEFFRSSARNFWSFLVILLIISIIILVLAFLVVALPISLVTQSSVPVEGAGYKTGIIVLPIFLIFMTILLLVADYARAWQVSEEHNACFKAIGFGFSKTFRTFMSSFPLMIIVSGVQLLFLLLILSVLPKMKPATGGGVFLLFLFSQFLFILKILLKVWRYGGVSSLMELNSGKVEKGG